MITEKPVQSHGIKCLFHKDEYKLYNMTRSTVYRKAHSAFLQGKSIGKIANDLQTHMVNMERSSAIRTARTAVTSAQNAGRMDSYIAAEKMGIKLKREWVATLDNRTRHAHAMLDGQKAELDKPFKVDGYSIMFPGDTSAPGYLVYNCRCTIVADIEGIDTSDTQRWSTGGDIPDMTYQEWVESKGREMTRRKVTESGREIIDKPTYNKLTRNFIKSGGVIIRGKKRINILI